MTIQLTYSAETQREAVAWFIPGHDPREWLNEIALWQVDCDEIRLYITQTSAMSPLPSEGERVPEGRVAGHIAGVVVTGCATPADPQRAIPWACLAGRLFVPVDAAFDPPVTEQELTELLPGENDVCVWHPQGGLIRFESGQALRVSDLLSCKPQRDTRWDCAEPGIAFARRLVSVTADELPSGDDIIESGRDDIGDESGQLSDLPPSPDEHTPGPIAKGAQSVKEWLAGAVKKWTSSNSGTPNVAVGGGSPGWWQQIENWANRVINQAWLDSERARELRRLLRMLDTDPDRGLRKAFPFGTGCGHRGTAPPSTRIGSRDVDFSMSRLTAGGPADAWDIPFEIQQQLFAKYRELANRELQLGRYRRAAYIFAELLGDLQAAAQALEQGGFYLEAAALYQDRLSLPKQAAQCLERGGLLHQAAELYEEQQDCESAARVYEQLGQTEDARQQWDRAVHQLIGNGDRFRAAQLTREKLGDVDYALGILDAAWVLGEASGPKCLTEWFRINGELGRHEDAAAQIAMLHTGERKTQTIVGVLADVHESYPDKSLRHQCADVSRVLVAERLRVAPPTEQEALVHGLSRFDRHDKLLKRDCKRFGEKVARANTARRPQRPRRPGEINLVFEEPLTDDINWRFAAATNQAICLAGFNPSTNSFLVDRIAWTPDGLCPERRWSLLWDQRPELAFWTDLQLLPDPTERQPTVVFLPQLKQLAYRSAPHPEPGFEVMSLSRLDPAQTLAVTTDHTGRIWRLANDGRTFWLENIDRASHAVESLADLTELFNATLAELNTEATDISPTIHLRVGHRRWFIARGTRLHVSDPQLSLERTIQFETPIIDLVVTSPPDRRRLIVSTTEGTYMILDSFGHAVPQKLEADLICARVTLSKGGLSCAADARRCVMTKLPSGELRQCDWPDDGTPLALVPTPRPDVFAALSSKGVVYGFEWT